MKGDHDPVSEGAFGRPPTHNGTMPEAPTTGADLFTASAQSVVDYLNRHTPLADWSVTRVAGGEQVTVHVHGEHLLEVGQRVDWNNTYCRRMVGGASPVVPDTLADPDYADHRLAAAVRSYAGVPLTDDTGQMFGVLCGFGPDPMQSAADIDSELLALMGQLLSANLVATRTADRGRRAAEIAEALSQTDALTGLVNRRGWDALVDDADERMNAFGDLVAVAVIDLDGLKTINDEQGHATGDRLIATAAATLAAVEQRGDRIARYGGDEFAILANSIPADDLPEHFGVYLDALTSAGIAASSGFATASPSVMTVTDTFAAADRAMYADKAQRKDTPR